MHFGMNGMLQVCQLLTDAWICRQLIWVRLRGKNRRGISEDRGRGREVNGRPRYVHWTSLVFFPPVSAATAADTADYLVYQVVSLLIYPC